MYAPYGRQDRGRYAGVGPPRRRRLRYGIPAQAPQSGFDETDPFEEGPEDFGREVFHTLGIRTTGYDDGRGDDPDEEWPPHDAWNEQTGVARRDLLSDWVGPRRAELETDGFDPDQEYLFPNGEGGDDDDDDDDDDGLAQERERMRERESNRFQMNLDGLTDLDDVNQDELRNALEQKSSEPLLTRKQAQFLHERFKAAQDRAVQTETRAARRNAWLAPSLSAARWASCRGRIDAVFSVDIRARDAQRALAFLSQKPETLQEIQKAIRVARSSQRRQYSDFLQNLERRLQRFQQQKREQELSSHQQHLSMIRSGIESPRGPETLHNSAADPGQLYGKVGRIGPRSGGAIHSVDGGPPRQEQGLRQLYHHRGFFSALDVPVFSRAQWVMKASNTADRRLDSEPQRTKSQKVSASSSLSAPPAYYHPGNADFLSMRLGLNSKEAIRQAEQDALWFFKHHFGLDFSKESGAKRVVKTDNPGNWSITHATLPLVLQPYTVGEDLTSYISLAEGHLASSTADAERTSPLHPDPLGNGCRQYTKTNQAHLTRVHEAGWMILSAQKAVVLPTVQTGQRQQRKSRVSGAPIKRTLPRGGILATGFWILNRPDAPPALLRFQSAGIPKVEARLIRGPNQEKQGLQHEIVSLWDVYDTAQDLTRRPYRGIGRGVSVVRVVRVKQNASKAGHRVSGSTSTSATTRDRFSVAQPSHESRTMITLHH